MLLEFLQSQLRFTPIIETEFESIGPDNKPIWIAKNPILYDLKRKKLKNLNRYIKYLKSEKFKTKKQAEQYLFFKILEILKKLIEAYASANQYDKAEEASKCISISLS